MGTGETFQRTLLKACLVAGDETQLAKALGVPVEQLVGWLLSGKSVPGEVFLKAVDIVLADTKQKNLDMRAMLAEIKQRHPLVLTLPPLCELCIGMVGADLNIPPHELLSATKDTVGAEAYLCTDCTAMWEKHSLGWSRMWGLRTLPFGG